MTKAGFRLAVMGAWAFAFGVHGSASAEPHDSVAVGTSLAQSVTETLPLACDESRMTSPLADSMAALSYGLSDNPDHSVGQITSDIAQLENNGFAVRVLAREHPGAKGHWDLVLLVGESHKKPCDLWIRGSYVISQFSNVAFEAASYERQLPFWLQGVTALYKGKGAAAQKLRSEMPFWENGSVKKLLQDASQKLCPSNAQGLQSIMEDRLSKRPWSLTSLESEDKTHVLIRDRPGAMIELGLAWMGRPKTDLSDQVWMSAPEIRACEGIQAPLEATRCLSLAHAKYVGRVEDLTRASACKTGSLPRETFITDGRSHYMAHNIHRFFMDPLTRNDGVRERGPHRALVSVFGSAHLARMKYDLLLNYGFREIPPAHIRRFASIVEAGQ